ncbi:MAG TPA: hypothetical protein ENI62_04755 [Gammaproteobacteria bacterium]|nr:hypothetical protein [Gammaproteobacteria bacterium]
MEFAIYYTLGGIILYSVTDWILDRIEQSRGKPVPYRNLAFFAIFFVLAYLLMGLINPPPDSVLLGSTPGDSTPGDSIPGTTTKP